MTPIYLVFLTRNLQSSLKKTKSLLPASFIYLDEPLSIGILDVNKSYLVESGWVESKMNNKCFFKGDHWPWITFPAIDFLETLMLNRLNVLEFGAGASTLYFAKRCCKIISYEFDNEYFHSLEFVSTDFANTEIRNLDTVSIEKKFDYDPKLTVDMNSIMLSCITEDLRMFGIDASFFCYEDIYNEVANAILESNLILIDGGPRNTTLFLTSKLAKADTVVIVDNSDQQYLATGLHELKEAGFFEIPFAGLGPLNPYKSQTSFFVQNLESLSKLKIN